MSFRDKLKKLHSAAGKVRDTVVADDPTFTSRIVICNNCEYLLTISRQCKKCGCFVDAKTRIKGASCPIGKW